MKDLKIQLKLKKLVVKIEILYLQEPSNVWMTGNGVDIVVLSPTANGPGKRGEAGQPVSMVNPQVGVMGLADGVHLQIYLGVQHCTHDEENLA